MAIDRASHVVQKGDLHVPGLDSFDTSGSAVETIADDGVLIVGGGPVGLLLATVLAFYGVKSVLLERNASTTKWPKMDLTNSRSMELFRKLGLTEEIRRRGVPSHIPHTVLISSGLSRERALTQWLHPSVDEFRAHIATENNGTQPLEPYQRLSQAIFEAWLKEHCDTVALTDIRFGWKVLSVQEDELGAYIKTTAVNTTSGVKSSFISKYIAGCDGASSQVRRDLEIPLDGGPVPGYMLLIHFKSKDLARLQKQGQFWHIFFISPEGLGGAIIAQDEIDTWTTHLALPLDFDPEKITSHDAVYTVLGGMNGKYEIKIDEILVRSTYRPSIAIARQYSLGRIFLAGDAAHQNIPTGGYGMNMGLGDAFDLGWKLAAVINGHGGNALLESYEADRRPVASMSIERSGVHMMVHMNVAQILKPDPSIIDADSEDGHKMRMQLHEHYQTHDGENKDLGVEMGYRYKSSICIPDGSFADEESLPEPPWVPESYIPSTWPGSRAPHVFLNDGKPLFDLYGKYFTLVDFFDKTDRGSHILLNTSKEYNVPLKHVRLIGEEKAYQIWEKHLVIVRPDGHVSWRADYVKDKSTAEQIIATLAGLKTQVQSLGNGEKAAHIPMKFLATVGTEIQGRTYVLEKMGAFQQ